MHQSCILIGLCCDPNNTNTHPQTNTPGERTLNLPLSGWTDLNGITTSNPDCWYRCVYIGCLSACIARSQRPRALGTFRRWPSLHLNSCIINSIYSFGVICGSSPGGERIKKGCQIQKATCVQCPNLARHCKHRVELQMRTVWTSQNVQCKV